MKRKRDGVEDGRGRFHQGAATDGCSSTKAGAAEQPLPSMCWFLTPKKPLGKEGNS